MRTFNKFLNDDIYNNMVYIVSYIVIGVHIILYFIYAYCVCIAMLFIYYKIIVHDIIFKKGI